MYKHILIPTDGTKLSLKAAKTGARLARDLGAKVTALYVIRPYTPPTGAETMMFVDLFSEKQYLEGIKKHAAEALEKVKSIVDKEGVGCDAVSIVDSSPWEGIVKSADGKKCDVIVMASHGRTGLAGMLLGSETTKVLTHSKTPVLVCR